MHDHIHIHEYTQTHTHTEYQPRFPMYKIAQRSVNKHFSLNMTLAIRRAIHTAGNLFHAGQIEDK